MRRSVLFCLLSLLPLTGCPTYTFLDDGGSGSCPTDDMPGVPVPDMAAPVAKCAAAKGLSGDNLLCVDFDKVTALTDPALAGWNFNANMADCWQIAAGALSVKNFATFTGNCGLTLPPVDLKQADKQKYQRVTLALLHKVDMSDPDQQAQVFLDLDSPARLVHQTTSRPGIPTLTTTTLTINKADLPMALSSIYKFWLKASALTVNSRQGWQIQSIAVNGSQ
jgi:hypothetical protein